MFQHQSIYRYVPPTANWPLILHRQAKQDTTNPCPARNSNKGLKLFTIEMQPIKSPFYNKMQT